MADYEGVVRDDPATKEFLSAEEAARELVRSLRDLHQATENYAAAEKRLGEAGSHLGDAGRTLQQVAQATENLGNQVSQGIDAIRSISGPRLIAEIQGTQNAVRDVQTTLRNQQAELSKGLQAVADKMRVVTYLLVGAVVLSAAAFLAALLT